MNGKKEPSGDVVAGLTKKIDAAEQRAKRSERIVMGGLVGFAFGAMSAMLGEPLEPKKRPSAAGAGGRPVAAGEALEGASRAKETGARHSCGKVDGVAVFCSLLCEVCGHHPCPCCESWCDVTEENSLCCEGECTYAGEQVFTVEDGGPWVRVGVLGHGNVGPWFYQEDPGNWVRIAHFPVEGESPVAAEMAGMDHRLEADNPSGRCRVTVWNRDGERLEVQAANPEIGRRVAEVMLAGFGWFL